MRSIQLPDHLFAEAARKAAASGLSLERFVMDAVQLHLHDDLDEPQTISLSPEQIAVVRESQADMKAGRGVTLEQARAELAENRAAWRQADQS